MFQLYECIIQVPTLEFIVIEVPTQKYFFQNMGALYVKKNENILNKLNARSLSSSWKDATL